MNSLDIQLPSNRKFGLTFGTIFTAISLYLLYCGIWVGAFTCLLLSVTFVAMSVIAPNLLSPLNKLWMHLGLMLGIVVNPIVIGIIFFGLITPLAILMRLFGRDELRLRTKIQPTYWLEKKPTNKELDKFENQF